MSRHPTSPGSRPSTGASLDDPEVLLRRARRESALALQLLADQVPPPVPLPEPVPVGRLLMPEDTVGGVQWNIEAFRHDGTSATVAGWAFARIDRPVHVTFAFQSGTEWFVVGGKKIERPDVGAAFPSAPGEPPVALHCGFLFEFSTRTLPAPLSIVRLLLVGAEGFLRATPTFAAA